MKNMNRLVALLLVLVMVFTALVSCNKNDPDKDDNGDGDDLLSKDNYCIVTDGTIKDGDTISEALDYFSDALKSVYDGRVLQPADVAYTVEEDNYTFLVGNTRLDESDAISSNMKINDYAYKVVSERLVVIKGGSFDAIKKCIYKFCEDVLGYTGTAPETATKPALVAGTEYSYTGTYGNSTVTINGIDITKFKISIYKDADLDKADKLVRELGKHNGHSIPVVLNSDLEGTEDGVICLSTMGRETTKTLSPYAGGYRISVTNKDGKYTAGIAGSTDAFYEEAFNKFFGEIKTENVSGGVTVTLPVETLFTYSYEYTKAVYNNNPESVDKNFVAATPWTRDDSKTKHESLGDGIDYYEYYYTNEKGKPYRANVVYADTDKYQFVAGLTPAAGKYYYIPTMMKDAASDGYDVIAAVNGQRWETIDAAHKGQVYGPQIYEGNVLTTGYKSGPFLGLTKTGEYEIGWASVDATTGKSTLDTTKYSMCLGGDFMLVDRGEPQKYKYYTTDEHLHEAHPRTLVGIKDDGTLVLVVIDGRSLNAGVSSGGPMENCADLMASLGCYMAMSLDGGGSSEMVIRYGSTYTTKNNPSDGSSRGVRDCIIIAKKETN